jgi:hypothetical protein
VKAAECVELTEDRHQQALYRLAAVNQYLYDTMGGDERSDQSRAPMPKLAMEPLREAQSLIELAIKNGQRTRRKCLGGDLVLIEWARYVDPEPGEGKG